MNLDWSVVWQNSGALAQGVLITILLTFCTMLIAIPGGIVLALMRLSSSRILSGISACFVEFFRNVPIILLIYWTFYVLPVFTDISFSPFGTGLLALALNVSAYNSETFRAGINSIRRGQTEAALALGMSHMEAMLKIILPQAARRVLPVLASTWISLFKDTSLVSVIAVGDLAHNALEIRAQSFRVLEILTAMAVIYWVLGYPQAKLVDRIYKKWGVKE
ncbi:amino acid ABC transporter permease [Neorhizobium alkalisoli]|uniref:Glutamate/aspartate import permease protein GltK n=1 Tax=Neorhizobium alkalisoli TaxID=528178 RepID=A0A561R9I6_9HYPH|nr:amino acid ABC transporter permease [Neorhizobium alkalisoli]TWF59257.1 polar amino acid transport system permease protein [Neorhizobium alkalisoli]